MVRKIATKSDLREFFQKDLYILAYVGVPSGEVARALVKVRHFDKMCFVSRWGFEPFSKYMYYGFVLGGFKPLKPFP